jgi:putative membrane protein
MVESSSSVDSVVVQSRTESTSDKSKGTLSDHLANERTFLAWTRTSLGIFAFGCAVARFGGSNGIQTTSVNFSYQKKPLISGLVLIGSGVITMFYGIYRYYIHNRQIIQSDFTKVSQIREPIIATLLLLLSMVISVVIFVIA